MKKIIAMLLALVMVFALVACGAPAANESKPAAGSQDIDNFINLFNKR